MNKRGGIILEEANENMRDERNVMVLFLSDFKLEDANENKQSESGEKRPAVYRLKESKPYAITRKNGDKDEEIKPLCIQTNEAPIKDVLYNLNGRPLDAVFYLESKAVKGVKKDKKNNKEIAQESIKIVDSKEDTEPQEYDNAIELFLGKRLPSINEDKLLKGILKKPLSRDIFYGVEFNEFESDTSKECIEVTLALEKKIREYMENEIGSDGRRLSMKNCNLYVDITGGMRTANMAISAAAQLLQYDGAHLQRMVYSDFNFQKVFDVQPINDLYKLVAGVYAFTNYGRSEALNDYFGDETYEPLHSLRKTMDEFSDAVQLCQEGLFEIKLRKLIEQLEKFPDDANTSAKVKLFRRMIPNMLSEYSSLVSKNEHGHIETNRIEIIRWCVKNKLLQQAITFCTEWLPEYLIDHGVVYIDDPYVQRWIKDNKYRGGISYKKFFLMRCVTSTGKRGFYAKDIYDKKNDYVVSDISPQDIFKAFNKEINKDEYKFVDKDQSGNAAKLVEVLLNCGILKSNLTDEDTKDAIYYIKEYTYIRAKLRNKVNHADPTENDPDDEMTVDKVSGILMEYLDNLVLLKNKPVPKFTGLWAKKSYK